MLLGHVSYGIIENIVQGAMRKSKPAITLLENMLQEAPVVEFDELGYYNNKNRFGNGMYKPHPCRFVSVQQAVPQKCLRRDLATHDNGN